MAESMHTTCNRCGAANGRRHRWCVDCKREYDRKARARAKALRIAERNIRIGVLTPEPCCVCGEETVSVHHDDPAQPLQVRWVCAKCAPLLAAWSRREAIHA